LSKERGSKDTTMHVP